MESKPSSEARNVINLQRRKPRPKAHLHSPPRPGIQHQGYAPGPYTGYGAKPIAAVREYMDEKKWTEAEAQVPGVAKVLEDVAAAIGKAADDLDATTSSGR